MIRKWQQVLFPLLSDSDKLFTEYTVSKTEQSRELIVDFLVELDVVSAMVRDLEQLLGQQLNFIKMKNQVAT